MRKIKVVKWKETVKGEEIETDTTSLLDMMIKMAKPEEMPRGLDNFRIMNRLDKAFTKAKKTGTIELEEQDYKFLKDKIEKDVPAFWGSIPEASEAIELFVEAKSDLTGGKQD